MTPRSKLLWWLVVNLSAALTIFAAWTGHAQNIWQTDSTHLAAGIVAAYFAMTCWIGWAVHVPRYATPNAAGIREAVPERWANWLIGVMPALGLIGTLIGIVDLFAFGGGAIENEQVYRGLGTALYVTLCGLTYSEFLILQMRVLGRG